MAQRGDGALALGYATVASFIGGIFSLVVLIFIAPLLAKISLEFGPIETFALLLFALTTVAWVSGQELLKGVMAALVGLFLALVGTDNMSGYSRFDFGNLFLSAGFTIIPLLIGFFAISEILYQAATLKDASMPSVKAGGFKLAPWPEWKKRISVILRSCGIGSFNRRFTGHRSDGGGFCQLRGCEAPRQESGRLWKRRAFRINSIGDRK